MRCMVDNADILCVHLDQLVELARHAEPEDRARLERTIQLARQVFDAVVLAQQLAQRASPLTEEAEANAVHRRIELTALMAELRIIGDDTSR